MNIEIWLPLACLVAVVVLHLLAIRSFPKLGLLDFPQRYGYQRDPIPYPTGTVTVGTFLVAFALLQPWLSEPWSAQHLGLMAAITLLAVFSFIDDRLALPYPLRLAIQVVCALLIFATGTRIYTLTNPLASVTGVELIQLDTVVINSALLSNPSITGAIFTVVWLGLTINALNWFDGIPGQVSSLSCIGFLTIGLLSLSSRVDQPELALLCFILSAIALGAFIFDFPPTKVLMGDTGAMFFGLMLGVVTIYAGGKVATAFLVLGVPLIDSVIVVTRRLLSGQSPFKGNVTNQHLHHRLLARGWSKRAVILLTIALGSSFGVTALFLSTLQKFVAAVLLFTIMLVLSAYSRETHVS